MWREREGRVQTADVGRRCRISFVNFYRYKAKSGWLVVSDAFGMSGLEQENAKLKKQSSEQHHVCLDG